MCWIWPPFSICGALGARGIHDGDILVADAAAEPRAGVVCVAMVGGDVILATLRKRDDVWVLRPSSGKLITIADCSALTGVKLKSGRGGRTAYLQLTLTEDLSVSRLGNGVDAALG